MKRIILVCLAALAVRTTPGALADAPDPLADSYKLEASNDLTGAARAMRKVVDASPSRYFPRLRMAYLSLSLGDYLGAADGYRVAARLAPTAIEPLLGEQLALVSAGRWDEAEAVAKQILALDAESYLARSRLAWTRYKKKDYRAAAELYAALIVAYPGDVDMRLGLGWALLGLGRKDDAAAAFREALTMVPKQVGATEGLTAATH